MKHCLVFASLISPSKMILFEKKYQTFDTVFHHQMKHLEVRQKYSAARRIYNSLLGVSSGDETLHLMLDILLESLKKGKHSRQFTNHLTSTSSLNNTDLFLFRQYVIKNRVSQEIVHNELRSWACELSSDYNGT